MKCISSWFGILAVIIVVIWFGFSRTHAPAVQQPQPKLSVETPSNTIQMIEVTAPTLNASVTSPLAVTGRARGPWYFEASFPIELQKNDGTVIVTTTGKAQGDWMTENWVPFTTTLSFPAQPTGSVGKIVLKRDNPSGEPQNDMSLVIPVQF